MAETINDLYLKYVNGVNDSLEQDRYFKYLYEMVQAGNNTLTQKRQVLHKVVDEKWLSTIEEALEPLNRIVENPRRTIERNEEVVPVSLARKITADSVRHLGMNTQFIASAEEDDIQPTHILNVSVDETYNLYENRFIYHLIQRLVTFIDKRTDVIFWSTGDETQNIMRMESKVDDAYEQIDYAIEMKIKNLQSFAENDEDNMNVFMRIDRVRRLVMALKNSSFCEIMAGCEKVRSPIQRTNLLVKDRDYRVCYQLWGFLENYDEVGYSIEVEDSTIQIDEEYLIQMYTNLITNYAVFKSVTEPDKRDMEQVAGTKRRVIRPKIITDVIEEEVKDYNIPDVEIKKVFVEEVTQAQLEAEAKLKEETRLRIETEEALKNAEKSASHSMMRVEFALAEQEAAREAAAAEKAEKEKVEAKLAQVIEEKEELNLKLQEMDNLLQEKDMQLSTEAKEYIAQIEEQKKYFTGQIDDLAYKNERMIKDLEEEFQTKLENTELEYFEKMNKREDELNQEYDALKLRSDDALSFAEENLKAQIEAQAAAYEKQLEEKDAHYEEILNAQLEANNSVLEKTKEEFMAQLTEEKTLHESQLIEQAKSHEEEVHSIRTQAREELAKVQAEDALKLKETEEKADKAIANMREQSDRLMEETRGRAADEILKIKGEADAKIKDITLRNEEVMKKLEADTTAKYEELRQSSQADYAKLKEESQAQLKEVKESLQKTINEQSQQARDKETELTKMLASLRRENELLMKANEDLNGKLTASAKEVQRLEADNSKAKSMLEASEKRRLDAITSLEKVSREKQEAQREAALLKAIEDQVRATSVAEFRKALRDEKKLRRQSGK